MISNESFVMHSMDLNLFFMRIMKEHLIFVQASLPQKNINLKNEADILKNEASRLLEDIIKMSNGFVSKEAINSREFVTEYTLPAERKTEFYTGIHIDGRLTLAERSLVPISRQVVTPIVVENIILMNQKAISLVMSIIAFKEELYENVLKCRVYTSNYPHMIDHMIRESKLYLGMLMRLQDWNIIDTEKELLEQEIFWNHILEEHAKFMRGMFDPTEEQLIKIADEIAKTFENLEQEAENVKAQNSSLEELTRKSLEESKGMRDFNSKGVIGILGCEVKSTILPLLADHTLREANHYIRILNKYNNM